MGKKALNLIGQKYGRLLVLERTESKREGNKVLSMWICQCDCGNKAVVAGYRLKGGQTHSCGCLQRERASETSRKHGQWNSSLYKVWNAMIQRCENQNDQHFEDYGARGITVFSEWKNFELFYEWAVSNGYEKGLSLDRKDNDKGYSPDNCHWTTRKVQMNNTRKNHYITYNGKKQTMAQWADELGIKYNTLNSRINTLGWDIERAFNTP